MKIAWLPSDTFPCSDVICLSSTEEEVSSQKRIFTSEDDETLLHQKRAKFIQSESSEDEISHVRRDNIIFESDEEEKNETIRILSSDDEPVEVSAPKIVNLTQTPIIQTQHDSRVEDELLKIFNTSTIEAIVDLSSLGNKEVKRIIEYRPFTTFDELETVAKNLKLSKMVRNTRAVVDLLTEIDELLEQVQELSLFKKIELPEKKNLPKSYKNLVKDYQLEGAFWLLSLHELGIGGILADEMGLGKTLQTIIYLGQLKANGHKPNIIVCPLSTMGNWARELEMWDPSLTFTDYHGSKDERLTFDPAYFAEMDVILTTYDMACGATEDRRFLRKLCPKSVILDEGHIMKNGSTKKYQKMLELPSQSRILLTGTPVNNNLKEVMSLLAYVVPSVFADHLETLMKLLHIPSENANEFISQRVDRASSLLKPFILRRYKKDLLLNLPKKTIEHVIMDLPSAQHGVYHRFAEHFRNSDDNSFLTQALELRKICLHPMLVRNLYDDDKIYQIAQEAQKLGEYRKHGISATTDYFKSLNDHELMQICARHNCMKAFRIPESSIVESSAKFDYLTKHLPTWIGNGDKILIFSQFVMALDLLEYLMKVLNIVILAYIVLFEIRWFH